MVEILKFDLPKSCTILFGGDCHDGSVTYMEEEHIEALKRTKRERRTWFFDMGDVVEGVSITHPYYNTETVSDGLEAPLAQYNHAMSVRKPYKDRILAILKGNHDRRWRSIGNFVRDTVCDGLGVKYGGRSAFVDLGNGVRGWVSHPSRNIRSTARDPIQNEAGSCAALKRFLAPQYVGAHFMLMGHTHGLHAQPPTTHFYTGLKRGRIVRATTLAPEGRNGKLGPVVPTSARWYGDTGAFCTRTVLGASDYGEERGFTPICPGYLEMKIVDGKITTIDKIYI